MVSNLYKANKFYDMQQEGKIASSYPKSKRLQFGRSGFFLNRKTSSGKMYKQPVKQSDYIYTRAETGATKYSKERDRKKQSSGIDKGKPKQHKKHAHMGDYKTSTNKIYKI
ncbi:MAG: hypothetical protein ACOC5T_05030 [Elusimicrobiota bacterium]